MAICTARGAATWMPPTRGLDHHINGVTLEDLAGQDFAWREGWEYRLR